MIPVVIIEVIQIIIPMLLEGEHRHAIPIAVADRELVF